MEPQDGKNKLQTLAHVLAIAYHVLEETKHMNLKPPLRPMSKLFAVDVAVPGSPASETETPQDEALVDVNGLTAALGGGHTYESGQGHGVVAPFVPEELPDTYTRLATLKTQYIKLSMELLEAMNETDKRPTRKRKTSEVAVHDDVGMAKRITRRNELRKEVYERNLVMKGLIDRLRKLQHSIRLLKGGSAYSPRIVMESV